MSKSTLNYFHVNGVLYHHYIDTETDATHVANKSDEVLYTVDSDGNVSDRAGQIGKFRMDTEQLWYFQGLSGLEIKTPHSYLIDAEMTVFQRFLAVA